VNEHRISYLHGFKQIEQSHDLLSEVADTLYLYLKRKEITSLSFSHLQHKFRNKNLIKSSVKIFQMIIANCSRKLCWTHV